MKKAYWIVMLILTGFLVIKCESSLLKWNLPKLAAVETMEVVKLSNTSVRCSGNISDDGGNQVIERGICYGTGSHPSINDNKLADGEGTGSFTLQIDGLEANTDYYFRAYAITKTGIAYGNVTPLKTGNLPTLSTFVVSSGITSAVLKGTVIDSFTAKITERGICYGTAAGPTIADHKEVSNSSTAVFSLTITGLTPATKYYTRAYATTAEGTGYGNEINFTTAGLTMATLETTAVSSVTMNSGVSGGTISGDGGSPVTERGICYSKAANPTVADEKISSGNGTGNFTVTLTGLTPRTTYSVRAYAINSVGTAYGNEITFTTASIFPPTVSTSAAQAVSFDSAVSGGSITSDGGGLISEKGVCFSTSALPTITDTKIASGSGTDGFSAALTNLISSTTYYVRAYAINEAGTAYGNEINFTTAAQIAKGSFYGGGIIFYLDASGKHGLIAASKDQGDAKWGCSGTDIPQSEATLVGTGSSNTLAIIQHCSENGTAARICNSLVLNGYSDWYLPSRDELILMYANLKLKNLGNFAGTDYWSSSQQNNKNSWLQSFSSGKTSAKNKNSSLRVRAIRSF